MGMQRTEGMFARFFENSLDIFCILTPDWKFVKLNKIAEKTLGHYSHDLEGESLLDFVHPDDLVKTIKVKDELGNNLEVKSYTSRIKCFNNTFKKLEWNFTLDEGIIYATARDIKRPKQVEKDDSLHDNLYNTVLDTITVGLVYARQSKFEWANRAFLDMFKCSLEDIKGEHLSQFYKEKNSYNKIYKEAVIFFKRGEPYHKEIEVKNDEGSIQWISFTGKTLYNHSPEDGTIWMIQNISKQKQDEKVLMQLAELQQTTLDTLTVGVSFIRDRKIEWCNKAHERIFDFQSGEMVNMPTSKFFKSKDDYKRVKKEGYPVLQKGGVYATQIECVTKEGKTIWVGLSGKAIDKDELSKGSIWMLNDITEKKAQKEKLFKNQKWLEDSQRIGKMGNWEMDLKTNIVFWSQSAYKIFGVDPKEQDLDFEEIIKLTHPDDFEMVQRQHEENMRMGKINSQFRIIRPNGDIRMVWSIGEIIYDDENNPERVIGIVQDITEQKEIELEIKEKDKGLKKSAAILNATMETIDDALLIVDSEKRVTHFNTNFAKLFNIPQEILETKDDVLFLNHAKRQTKNPEEFHKYVNDIYSSQNVIRDLLVFKNNHVIERLSYPLLDQSPVQGRVWLFRDITERIKNEERLNMFKSSIDLSSDEVYWLNEDASFYYVNERACKSLGYTKEELLNLKIFDIDPIFPKERWGEVWKWFQEHRNEENTQLQLESLHIRKDGVTFPIEVVLNHLWLGEKEFHVAHVRDISDRKKNEEHLNMFKTAIDNSLDEIYWLDKDANFKYFNNHALLSLGYTAEELKERNLFDIDPLYTKEKWDKLWESYQTKKNKEGIGTRKETLHKRKDGTIYPVEVMVNHIWLNDIELHISYVRDISERRQDEENLLKNQKMLIESQRIANVGSWELNLKTNDVSWSKQTYQIFGLKDYRAPVTLDYFFQFVHSDDRENVKQVIADSIKTKLFKNFECRIIRADNMIIMVNGVGELLLDEEGNATHVLGSVQDITEQKQAEEEIKKLNEELEAQVTERTSQLNRVNKELEAFAYSVSHDLRAPIRHIDGFLSLMYSNISEPEEKVKTYYQKISTASKRMSEMIDGLLKFSRLGRASIDFVSIDISELVNEILENLKPDYSQRSIKWDIKTLPVVSGDKSLLRIAFENVISNAVKHTIEREQAEIEIGVCKKQKDNVCIYIKDNGAGFDMAYKEKLFGVFQRLHSSNEFEGIGIGLANAKQIISKHNGKIDAVSEVDKGAIFYITLPI